MMEIIDVNSENIGREHICCAISNDNDCQVISKKTWLNEQFAAGLVFKKGNVRGKCFIEYMPAENAWSPVIAKNYMYINCFWVAGKFAGQGNGDLLLDACVKDSKEKGRSGLVVLSSAKKKPFLSDPEYLKHKRFRLADTFEPYFELLYLPFDAKGAEMPKFFHAPLDDVYSKGYVLFYTSQCPFTAKYVPLVEQIARDNGVAFKSVHIKTGEEARHSPTPFTAYSLFYGGKFLTHEILSEKKFEKILANNK